VTAIFGLKRNEAKTEFASFTEANLCTDLQESHAVAGKPRDAAVDSDQYQQPVGQKQSE